ncbi:MAG: PQQ-like beta-propeller repeat protein [Treponema sp.]|jgi:outer membrane protein assembly factor BamB|nr:PQQ-like beta-propeller repeat protein [Treponema sp.]
MKLLCLLLFTLCAPHIFAQDEASTGYLWRQALDGEVIGRPTVQAESVVVALDGGNVRAYSVSGRSLWNFSAPGRLSPYVARSREGTSYICRTNGIFFAVNRAGKELWRVNVGGALSGPPLIGWDGRVFVPAANKIFCYTASGNPLWARDLDGSISAGPCLDTGGGIVLALENGDVLRVSPYGAIKVKRLSAAPRIVLSAGRVSASDDASSSPLILAMYRDGGVQLLDLSQPDAAPSVLPRLPSPPLAAASRGESVAVLLANGQMIMLSGIDGTTLWAGDTHTRARRQGAENEAAVLFDERGVYALTTDGAAGFTADGRRLWHTALTNASGVPAFDDDGILYSGGKDWILCAWKLENRLMKKDQPLYGPAPEGSYGTGQTPQQLPLSLFYDDTQIQKQLESIRHEILAGRVGENEPEWLAWLMGIAGDSLRQNTISFANPRAYISQRILALQLLARIGSHETVPWLARLFRTENEPLVKAAAARAIGGIGADPNGMAAHEFLSAVNGEKLVRDEQVLVSIASAAGALCRFSGPLLSDAGSRILVLLSNANRPASVRRQALLELKMIGTAEK